MSPEPDLKDAAHTLEAWARKRRWGEASQRILFYRSLRRAAETPTGKIPGREINVPDAVSMIRAWAEGRRWARNDERDMLLRTLALAERRPVA